MSRARWLGWLGASLGVHALLWGWAALRPSPPQASLAPARSGTGVDVDLVAPEGRPSAPPRAAVKARNFRPVVARAPSPVSEASEGSEGSTSEGPSAPEPGQSATAAAGDGNGSGSGSGDGPPPAVDLRALSARLAEAARACYPAAARRFHATGEVELAFCAGADGRALSVSLRGTTGSSALDAAAQECVLDRAAPLPVTQGCYVLPVHFGGGP